MAQMVKRNSVTEITVTVLAKCEMVQLLSFFVQPKIYEVQVVLDSTCAGTVTSLGPSRTVKITKSRPVARVLAWHA